MKVTILGGAGLIGSSAGFFIAQKNLVEEVCLVDVRQNVAKSHEMDMEQTLSFMSKTRVTSGGWEQLAGSDIVVVAAGPSRTGEQKSDFKRIMELQDSVSIVKEAAQYIGKYAPQAVILTCTNPLDVTNSLMHRWTGIPASKVIGYSLNDTLRFRWVLSKILNVDASSIEAFTVGEHGDRQVPVMSRIFIGGKKIELTAEQKAAVLQMTHNFFSEHAALKAGRSSGWLSGVNIAKLIETMLKETGEVIGCSVIGEDGVSIGRTAVLNRQGIAKIVDLDLNEEEKRQFEEARNFVAGVLKEM
jgi:malate/lactate dehydrogenase